MADELPRTAKWGFRVCAACACLALAAAIFNPLVALIQAAAQTAFAWGIRRRHAWAAFAAAGLWLTLLPLLPLRVEIRAADQWLAVAILAAMGSLMLASGFSLWPNPAARTGAAPWIALLVLWVAGNVCFRPFRQPSISMEPKILAGDQFFVETSTWTLGRAPKRDEILVFRYPIDGRQTHVKRVAGIPGDRIAIRHGRLIRNGAEVVEPWAVHQAGSPDPYGFNFPSEPGFGVKAPAEEMLRANVHGGEVVVPAGEYFVLGDNRDDSFDSRYWGFVRRADIIGSPTLVYASYDEAPGARAGSMPTVRHLRWARLFKVL